MSDVELRYASASRSLANPEVMKLAKLRIPSSTKIAPSSGPGFAEVETR